MTEHEKALAKALKAETRDLVAVILAIGISTAINIVVLGVLYDALFNTTELGISENATQLLTMALGGIIGVLGSYVGGRNATTGAQAVGDATPTPQPTPVVPADLDTGTGGH